MNGLSGYFMYKICQGIFILLRKYYVLNEGQEQTKKISCIAIPEDNGVKT